EARLADARVELFLLHDSLGQIVHVPPEGAFSPWRKSAAALWKVGVEAPCRRAERTMGPFVWHERLGYGHRVVEGARRMAEQVFDLADRKGCRPTGTSSCRPRTARGIVAALPDGMTHVAQPVLQVDADLFANLAQHFGPRNS